MSLFEGLGTEGLEEKEDRIGGGSWTRETDAYLMEIKVAFAGKAASGARFIDFTFADEAGKEYQETFYITGSTAKGAKNYYMVKDKDGKETGKKRALPGFDVVNDICLLTTEVELEHQPTEEKTVKVYDPDAKQKLPKSVPVLVDLLGKKVILCIQKRLENKSAKDSNGIYQPIADTRETNTIEKAAHAELKLTVFEAQKGIEATFVDTWVEKNKGKSLDVRKIKDGEAGQAGRPGRAGAPPASAGGTAGGERKSLFSK